MKFYRTIKNGWHWKKTELYVYVSLSQENFAADDDFFISLH